MDRNVLKRGGFSLIELSLVFAIISVLIAIVFYSSGKIRQAALAQRSMQELKSIAVASLEYYSESGAWPSGVSDLRPKYLSPQASDTNPFGSVYIITPGMQAVSVSTFLPKGLLTAQSSGSEVVLQNQGNNDLVSITKSLESSIWKLKYEKKNIFKQ